jgi:hypothetical protein
MGTQTANAQTGSITVLAPRSRRALPILMLGIGLGVTGAWIALLGYWLITLLASQF